MSTSKYDGLMQPQNVQEPLRVAKSYRCPTELHLRVLRAALERNQKVQDFVDEVLSRAIREILRNPQWRPRLGVMRIPNPSDKIFTQRIRLETKEGLERAAATLSEREGRLVSEQEIILEALEAATNPPAPGRPRL